jgi:hypothetical protein
MENRVNVVVRMAGIEKCLYLQFFVVSVCFWVLFLGVALGVVVFECWSVGGVSTSISTVVLTCGLVCVVVCVVVCGVVCFVFGDFFCLYCSRSGAGLV